MSPCKNCKDRHTACHDECEEYIAFRKERDALLNDMRKQSEINSSLWEIGNSMRKRSK